MLPRGEPTTSYEGTGTFRPAAPVGTATEPSQELRDLLRRRLIIIAIIGVCVSGVVAAIVAPEYIRSDDWQAVALYGFLVAIPATTLVVVRLWRTLSLRGLRVVELTSVGCLVAAAIYHTQLTMVRGREGAVFAVFGEDGVEFPLGYYYQMGIMRAMAILGVWFSLFWVGIIMGYGLVFPNNRKRATVVISVLALIPIVMHGTICWRDPDISREAAFWYMLVIVGSMAFSASVVIFTAHRIESLRQAAAESRRLGQYQLKELLGSGGMGEVYRAEHLLLRRPCAIKLIRPERAGDPQNLRRFEREVQAMATLTNWHTVEIYDYGHAADGTFYYVMELLPGLTLEQLVKQYGPLPPARAVHLLRQVCVALREAHAIGLIHRDIKPSNIIVGERGGQPDVAKLLDFGLVRPIGVNPDGERITQTGAVVGTPSYVSPEQASDSPDVDARSDIYSLGAVAYYLLTGRPPFVGKTALHVLAAHLREDAKPLTDLRPDVPGDLQAVVLRCLEKEPGNRFADIDSLEEALAQCECADQWDRGLAAAWWRDHGQ